jgi:hypothetical protein
VGQFEIGRLDLGLKVTANAAIFPCMSAKAMGWQIVVTLSGGAAPQIYNVGIADEHQAVHAVRGILENPKGAVVKVKAELLERVFKALRIQPGQVLLGAQPRKKRPRDANRLGKSKRACFADPGAGDAKTSRSVRLPTPGKIAAKR